MNNKLALLALILLLGIAGTLFFYAFYNKTIFTSNRNTSNNLFTQSLPSRKLLFRFIVLSDTHLNSESFSYIRNKLNDLDIEFMVHLGDHTNFGTIKELTESASLIRSLGLPYHALAGDHDIAETQSLENFDKFFTTPPEFIYKGVKINLLNNPFNIQPFSDVQMQSILTNSKNADIILSSQPIFVEKDNFFNYKFMGSLENIENLSENNKQLLIKYNSQTKQLTNSLRKASKNTLVISGDHHRSAKFTDPVNPLVSYHIVGALSKSIFLGNKEIPQRSLQAQRFSVIEVYEKDSNYYFEIKEHIIEN